MPEVITQIKTGVPYIMPMMKAAEIEKIKKDFHIDAGLYTDALKAGVSPEVYLEKLMAEKLGQDSAYTHCDSTGQMIRTRRKIQALTGQAEPTALEKILLAHGIKAFGDRTDVVGKFWETTDTTTLFPVYISNRVYAGLIKASIAEDMVAVMNVIKGTSYQKLYLQDAAVDRSMRKEGRGGEFPETTIKASKENVQLEKFGRTINVDYEILDLSPISIYELALQRIGMQIGVDESNWLIYVLLNGDGNSNGLESGQTVDVDTTNVISKKDIIAFAAALPTPYQLTNFVGRTAMMVKFWDALSDMSNPVVQLQQIGIPIPAGKQWDEDTLTSDLLLGVDKSQAIGMTTTDQGMVEESEKLITKQVRRTVVSKRSGFHVIQQDAIGALNVTL